MAERHRILVVDDNEMICALLSEVLETEGYEVSTALSGEAALDSFQQNPFPLVLLDLMLPGISGTEVLKAIKQLSQQTDAVMITSHGTMESAIEALRLGAADYLTKPFDNLEQVTNLVRETFSKRRRIEEKEWLYRQILSKSRQLETAVKRLSSLNELSRSLYSILDLKELLQFSVQLVAREVDAERVSLMLLEKRTGELKIKASHGIDPDKVKGARCRLGEGVAGWVAQKGKALISEEQMTQADLAPTGEGRYRTSTFVSTPLIISVPIKGDREVIGVINVSNKASGEPFSEEDLQFVDTLGSQIAVAIDNAMAVNRELKDTHYQAILALAEALEAKDATSGEHSGGMLRYAEPMAERLGLPEERTEILRYAAVLHDIGKIGVPERILQKPAELSPEEFQIMQNHTRVGRDILRSMTFMAPVVPIIEAHHEWFDGSGYPKGLAGEAIPLEARIVAVLDAFDAMTAERPYRRPLTRVQALGQLSEGRGSQFDPVVVEVFLAMLKEFPM
ncbi:hypothetical protein DESUT3_28940 [Desulfuromonas versatilis]|uniref:Response regulator receiver modulated metal dependent phosphohydrolase n=1 Tax=Desulfuromonas versatilis TaxID=2802975 RepID=A0ABM8HV18_9BACT|nr:HD domain-containing phosphohydrolase [Desulfuromonas versatilis]BCR05825.1 hypothetical protein DESUT3_28940 [Desulfuromonas versatilis]